MSQPKRFLVMAGGTGGHVFPALAVARALQSRGGEVSWLGSQDSMEARIIGKSDISFHAISVTGLRGKGLLSWFLAPIKLLRALISAIQILRRAQPDTVLGMGGFATGPGGLAAKLMGKPLVIHEQNAVAGLTNRILARWAKVVLAGFPGAFGQDDRYEIQVVGNPIRSEIELLNTAARAERDSSGHSEVRILILGGSLGAQALNEKVPPILSRSEASGIHVRHQCGLGKSGDVSNGYSADMTSVQIEEFIDDMAASYQWADLVICRAGALTVAELCAAGRGAIFVPYPHAVDDHQTRNASFMEQGGAAFVVPQSELSKKLPDILHRLLNNPSEIGAMGDKARRLAKIDATRLAADVCWEVACA